MRAITLPKKKQQQLESDCAGALFIESYRTGRRIGGWEHNTKWNVCHHQRKSSEISPNLKFPSIGSLLKSECTSTAHKPLFD
jgi:hypothetical protein